MTYGATTYGGTALGSSIPVIDDVTGRVAERTLEQSITTDRRELQI